MPRTPTATPATPRTATTPTPAPASTAGSVAGSLFALLLVVGLILGLAWLAKRLPGAAGGGANGALRVVASVPLGQRERAVVVDVGGTQLLLGVGPGGTRTLHTLAEPLPQADAPPPFAQLLAQHFGKKP
ncbi:flagellar biosynthetic protein FliO [Lysobacter sp. A3-1-A15]|uniref:flagellar biosynthetic protein FliO n=1 Tax=Novilysobacter viscosus TaxID=3098602 RepID=UPI002ED86300